MQSLCARSETPSQALRHELIRFWTSSVMPSRVSLLVFLALDLHCAVGLAAAESRREVACQLACGGGRRITVFF